MSLFRLGGDVAPLAQGGIDFGGVQPDGATDAVVGQFPGCNHGVHRAQTEAKAGGGLFPCMEEFNGGRVHRPPSNHKAMLCSLAG